MDVYKYAFERDMHIVTTSSVGVMNVFIKGEVRREKAREEVTSLFLHEGA